VYTRLQVRYQICRWRGGGLSAPRRGPAAAPLTLGPRPPARIFTTGPRSRRRWRRCRWLP